MKTLKKYTLSIFISLILIIHNALAAASKPSQPPTDPNYVMTIPLYKMAQTAPANPNNTSTFAEGTAFIGTCDPKIFQNPHVIKYGHTISKSDFKVETFEGNITFRLSANAIEKLKASSNKEIAILQTNKGKVEVMWAGNNNSNKITITNVC